MKNFSSWVIVMFGFMFWAFRLVGTVMYSIGSDFMFEPTDLTMEVALLFVSFVCICFLTKRRMWAAIIYLAGNLLYYLPSLCTHLSQVFENTLDLTMYMPTFFELIGVILPIAAMFDVLVDKNRKLHPTDKKTDWFYKNKDFDRQMDERADKNNYRTL